MSPLKNADTQKLVLSALGLFALAIGFHQFLWHTDSPYLFTRDDNLTYFLPLIKWHTQVVSSFHLPRMNWAHGVGWDPFMSWQAGLFYPPYLVAHWLSELIQMPHAIFEISFVMHQMILAVFILLWGPQRQVHRVLLAVALMFAPASFLLGTNWHLYGVSHVWWVGGALWIHGQNKQERPFASLQSKAILFAMVLMFFSVSHPQMFVWGGLFWVMWLLIQYPFHQTWRQALLLLLCTLPLWPSLILLKWVSLGSSEVNLRAINDTLALERAVPLSVSMLGALLGNLGDVIQIPMHKNTAPDGALAGIYFQPALWWCFFLGIRKRMGWLLVSCCLVLALLGIESFPFLSALFVGPFEGFRLVFKIIIFTSPLFLLCLIPHLDGAPSQKNSAVVLGLIGIATLVVCFKGRHIDGVYETYDTPHHAGSLLQEMHTCFEEAQIPPGARLAYVDAYQFSKKHSALLPFLLSNTPSLLQRHTVHLYEPLEPDTHAEGHLNLDSFHGLNRPTLAHKQNATPTLQAIQNIGGTHVFTKTAELLPSPTRTSCTDAQGHPLFFQAVPEPREGPFPQLNGAPHVIKQDPDGRLMVVAHGQDVPEINSVIPIRWEKTATGWFGIPNPIHPLWGLSTLLLGLLTAFFFWRLGQGTAASEHIAPQAPSEEA